MKKMNDLVKCSRCNKTLIAESFKDHDCSAPFRGSKTIMIDYQGTTKDEFGRKVILAHGMDGVMYRLVEDNQEAIPIPFEPTKRKFTGEDPNGVVTEPPSGFCIIRG